MTPFAILAVEHSKKHFPLHSEDFMSQATYHDAELVLRLYDLRRETVMRQARDFFANFSPSSFEELMVVMGNFGSKENAYLRQVLGYWEMVASLVVHGTINAALAQDT